MVRNKSMGEALSAAVKQKSSSRWDNGGAILGKERPRCQG
jgi:hypothetical protein